MELKCCAVFALAVVASCITYSSAESVTWGNIGPYDSLLYRTIVTKKSSFLRKVTDDFVFPEKGKFNTEIITEIRVIDQYTKGNGGHATLMRGGPGKNEVTIHLKSQRGEGFNFMIEIYGR